MCGFHGRCSRYREQEIWDDQGSVYLRAVRKEAVVLYTQLDVKSLSWSKLQVVKKTCCMVSWFLTERAHSRGGSSQCRAYIICLAYLTSHRSSPPRRRSVLRLNHIHNMRPTL